MSSGPDPLTTAAGGPKTPAGTSLSCLFTWLGTRGDYSSIDRRDKALKGWKRYFSSVTKEGRVNIVIGTYLVAAVAGVILWKNYKAKNVEKYNLERD